MFQSGIVKSGKENMEIYKIMDGTEKSIFAKFHTVKGHSLILR